MYWVISILPPGVSGAWAQAAFAAPSPPMTGRQLARPLRLLDESTPVATTHTTEDVVEGRDELARILAGVTQLPDERREALIMRFALGMDNREIARALGKTDGATKVLIHRAIKQLEGIVKAGAVS